MENARAKSGDSAFVRKVWITGGIYALIVIAILFIRATFSVFLLILAGALIAIYFTGLSNLLCRKLHCRQWAGLLMSVMGTIILLTSLIWLIGGNAEKQVSELSEKMPQMIDNAKATISENHFGKMIIDRASSPSSIKKARGLVSTFFRSTFGVLGDIYVILFIGIFFTVSPRVYTNGIVQLIPQSGQNKAEEVLNRIGQNLAKWLKGKMFSMAVVMILTAIGLSIIGLPMWLALAILAGILNFIPNFGPLIAMIPAVLVALMQGTETAAIVAAMYIGIQVVESNFITPFVQQKLVSIPPALIIIAQLVISPLTGGWGLVLATPLMLIAMTLVQELYIKKRQ